MKNRKKGVTLAALAVTVILGCCMLAGCGSAGGAGGTGGSDNVIGDKANCVIIYAKRSNSLGDFKEYGVQCIDAMARSWGYLDIIRADGNPKSSLKGGRSFDPDESIKSTQLQSEDVENQVEEFKAALDEEAMNAQEPEVDLYKAFKVANDSLSSSVAMRNKKDGYENVVVVIDSGISTKGYVDFTAMNVVDADLNLYIKRLFDEGSVGEKDLDKIDRVEWYCFNQTAPPQAAIPGSRLPETVQVFYKDLLTKAGVGQVNFPGGPTNVEAEELANLPKVTAANVETATQVFNDSAIKFISASDEFSEPQKAKAALEYYAQISKERDLAIVVTGYTDKRPYDKPGGNQRLSELRAERVKQTLVDLGVVESSITTEGKGVSTQYEDDAENRRVELRLEPQ